MLLRAFGRGEKLFITSKLPWPFVWNWNLTSRHTTYDWRKFWKRFRPRVFSFGKSRIKENGGKENSFTYPKRKLNINSKKGKTERSLRTSKINENLKMLILKNKIKLLVLMEALKDLAETSRNKKSLRQSLTTHFWYLNLQMLPFSLNATGSSITARSLS